MRDGARRSWRVSALSLSLLCGGCGGELGHPALDLRFSQAALLTGASAARLSFYAGNQACATLPDQASAPAVYGPKVRQLSDADRREGFDWRLDDPLPAGMYTVLLLTLAEDGAELGIGCVEAQPIAAGETTRIELTVKAAP